MIGRDYSYTKNEPCLIGLLVCLDCVNCIIFGFSDIEDIDDFKRALFCLIGFLDCSVEFNFCINFFKSNIFTRDSCVYLFALCFS